MIGKILRRFFYYYDLLASGVATIVLAMGAMTINVAHAQSTISVAVVDQNKVPVPNAVVALPGVYVDASDPQTAIMDQKNKAFVPGLLAIDQNTWVSFPNSDNIRHHVYSFSEPKRFEIKLYADSPEAPVLFEEPGIVVLGCNIHDAMVGHIFVSKWERYAITDAHGMAYFKFSGDLPSDLLLWHSRLNDPTQVTKRENIKWNNNEAVLEATLVPLAPPSKTSRFR